LGFAPDDGAGGVVGGVNRGLDGMVWDGTGGGFGIEDVGFGTASTGGGAAAVAGFGFEAVVAGSIGFDAVEFVEAGAAGVADALIVGLDGGIGGALNVPVEEFDFCGGTGACGGRTSTDRVKVLFSAACSAPTFTTCRVTSSPRSLRMAMIT